MSFYSFVAVTMFKYIYDILSYRFVKQVTPHDWFPAPGSESGSVELHRTTNNSNVSESPIHDASNNV